MMMETSKVQIPDRVYFKIGDVAHLIGVKPYVLRYWETEFPMISPTKSKTGQRVYRRSDVETVAMIKHLLYIERFSIEGARKRISSLRKDGELKSFKGETVAAKRAGDDTGYQAQLKEARACAKELRELGRMPLSKLFSW